METHATSEEPSIRQSEEPPLREIPLLPTCGDCPLQCCCPIGIRKYGARERVFPVLNAAASAHGKRGVRQQLSQHDSGVIEDILRSDAHGLPNVKAAACVHQRNEAVIRHAAASVLHDRRSTAEHGDRREKTALRHARNVASARTPSLEELPPSQSVEILREKSAVSNVKEVVATVRAGLASFMRWVAASATPVPVARGNDAGRETSLSMATYEDHPMDREGGMIDEVESIRWMENLRRQ